MATFAFRLDPVLTYRQRLEDQQQIVLAGALRALRDAEAVRDESINRRTGMRERIRVHHREIASFELRATYAHNEYLDRAIVTQQRFVDQARVEVEQERAKLIATARDKKILATLKERRRETFAFEVSATEQREGDEINARRFNRSR